MEKNQTLNESDARTGFEYEMEDLIPIVSKLANKYVSAESSSITYETAEKLMNAVLFCIREHALPESELEVLARKKPAEQAYEAGYQSILWRVKNAMEFYNQITEQFDSYGNLCLQETIMKGFPEFFRWYDVKFDPSNSILTLDYPILKDLSQLEGIYRMEEYLAVIHLEQTFLRRFEKERVTAILSQYDADYRIMINNLCEVVLQDVLMHLLLKKPMQERLEEKDKEMIRNISAKEEEGLLKEKVSKMAELFIRTSFPENEELINYLLPVAWDLAARMVL